MMMMIEGRGVVLEGWKGSLSGLLLLAWLDGVAE